MPARQADAVLYILRSTLHILATPANLVKKLVAQTYILVSRVTFSGMAMRCSYTSWWVVHGVFTSWTLAVFGWLLYQQTQAVEINLGETQRVCAWSGVVD